MSLGQAKSLETHSYVSVLWKKIGASLRTSVFVFKTFSWLDEVHPYYGGFCFTYSQLIVVLITSTNAFLAISRLMFDRTVGHHSLAKLIHKINDHREVGEPSHERQARFVNWFVFHPKGRGKLCKSYKQENSEMCSWLQTSLHSLILVEIRN